MQNLTNVEIFMYDVIDGNGELYTLIIFYLITSARHKQSNWVLHCYNNGSVTMTSYGKELLMTYWGRTGVKNPKLP
jgi:hypothetical protein